MLNVTDRLLTAEDWQEIHERDAAANRVNYERFMRASKAAWRFNSNPVLRAWITLRQRACLKILLRLQRLDVQIERAMVYLRRHSGL